MAASGIYHKDLGGASWPTTSGKYSGSIPVRLKPTVSTTTARYVDDWIGWDWVTGVKGCKKGEDCSTVDK